MPLPDRKYKAAITAGFKTETRDNLKKPVLDRNARNTTNGKIPKVEKAIKIYQSLQYDEDMETYLAFREQIRQYKEFLNKKNKTIQEYDKSMKIMKMMAAAIEMAKELRISLGIDEKEAKEMLKDRKVSTIDLVNMGKLKVNLKDE